MSARFGFAAALVRLLVGTALACILQGCSDAATSTTSHSAGPTSAISTTISTATRFFDDLVRQALEKVRDTTINPLIAANMPEPLPINLTVGGTANAGCATQDTSGGCLCPVTAKYTIHLKEVDGLSSLHITDFKTVKMLGNQFDCLVRGCDALVVADVADENVTIKKGVADVAVTACGITRHSMGSVTTHVDTQATLTVRAHLKPDLRKNCVQVSFTKVDIVFDKVTLHDTTVDLNIAGMHFDVSFIAHAIENATPDVGKDIANSISGVLSDAITGAAAQIPCVNIPVQNVEVV